MKNLIILFLYLLNITCLISCSDKAENINTGFLSENKIILGTSADNPPYEFLNKGDINGFDIELAKLISNELGRELIVKNLDFSGLLPAILSNNVDIVIAGLSYNEKRLENVDFSIPYVSTKMSVLYNSFEEWKSILDLSGKRIGVQIGTSWADMANKISSEYPGTSVKILTNNLVLVQELNNNNIDAVILEDIQVKKFIELYPNLKKFDIEGTSNDFVIALSKNSQITSIINDILKKLEEEGKIKDLKAKWLK